MKPNPEIWWLRHRDDGLRHFHDGRDVEAERSFRAALRLAEGMAPRDDRHFWSLYHLADLLRRQGRCAEAAALYGRAVDEAPELLSENDPAIAAVEHAYARALRRLGREDEANQLDAHAARLESASLDAA